MIEHFPLDFEPYEHQAQVLRALEVAIKSDKKFILLRAPTGSGKSAIAISAALSQKKIGRGTHLLVSRRFLQQQYLDEYTRVGLANIWGKANYPCVRADVLGQRPRSCAECIAKGEKNPSRYIKLFCSSGEYGNLCPYINARKSAADASITLANYESFLAHAHYTKILKPRGLMIIDEAHALDGRLSNFASVAISSRVLSGTDAVESLPNSDSGDEYADWLCSLIEGGLKTQIKAYSSAAGLSIADAEEQLSVLLSRDIPLPSSKGGPRDKLISAVALKLRLEKVATLIAKDPDNWVCYKTVGRSGRVESVEFKPVVLRGMSHRYMFDFADKVLLISATLNTGPFLRTLGISKKDVAAFIDVDSTFDLESRALISEFCGSMAHSKKDRTFPKVSDKVGRILAEYHPLHKGCIHTHSFSNARALKESLPKEIRDRVIWHTSSTQNVEQLIKQFYASDNKWLASPSCTEGLDGKGDRIRAQILIKAPYAAIKDPRVSARRALPDGQTWYAIEALNTLMQAYGRGTRSKEDWSVTYVLDSGFSNLVLKNLRSSPSWFVDAWSRCSPGNWVFSNGRWRLAS